MKTLLIFPPVYGADNPYLSIPLLTAYLRERGHDTVQRDLDVETCNILTRKTFLEKSLERVREGIRQMESGQSLSKIDAVKYRTLSKAEMSGEFVIENIEKAAATMRSEKFYTSPPESLRAKKIISTALQLVSAPYFPTLVRREELEGPWPVSTSKGIIEAVHDEQHNIFRHVFKEYFLPSILEEKPDLVGISMVSWWQIVPAFTLAALLKESGKDFHVCMGGNIFTFWEDLLPGMPDLFQFFDSIVVREGEKPLLRLVEAIDQQKSLETVPNLIYKSKSGIKVNPLGEKEKIDAWPTPVFDGIPLDSYFLPELVLPYSTSRGCSWRKCAICDHWYGPQQYYECRNMDLVMEDLVKLTRQYNCNYFFFVDEDISPARMKQLAKGIMANGLNIKWMVQQRLEKKLTSELARDAARAGCKVFLWGFESACQRILDLMEKGTNVETTLEVLTNCHNEGIWNTCYEILGFPTETEAESEQTIRFVADHSDVIDSVFPVSTWVYRQTRLAHEPDRFSIHIENDPAVDLPIALRYTSTRGMSMWESMQMVQRHQKEISELHPNYEIWEDYDLLRVLIYVGELGYTNVKNMVPREKAPLIEQTGDEENIIMELKEGVFQKNLAFDISKKEEAVPRQELDVLYSLFYGSLMTLKPNIKKILDMIKKGNPLGKIMKTLSKESGVPYEQIREACLKLVNNLTAKGFTAVKKL